MTLHLAPGTILTALPTSETVAPWLVLGAHVSRGRSFDLYEVSGEGLQGGWLAKIPWLPEELPAELRERRFGLLPTQAELGALGLSQVATGGGLFRVSGAAAPAIVEARVEGETLADRVRRTGPLSLVEALELGRGLCALLISLHGRDWVARCLSPEHIVLRDNDLSSPVFVGLGNGAKRQSRVEIAKRSVDPRYTSPEAIGEVSGIYLVPRTDIYSLGCILAFAVSGEHPTGRPEAPWSDAAFARFAPLPDGFRLLVAHLTQTLHKHRSATVEKVLTWMSEESLPTMATPGFGALSLLRPLDAEKEPEAVPAAAAAHLSVLSPGPLVVRPREAEVAPTLSPPTVSAAKPAEAPAEAAAPAAERRWWSLLGWLLLALALASLVARALRS